MDQIITAGAGESTLPAATRAIQITERIRANGRTAVNAVCAIGEDLRTMKIDGLYTELGYESFEDYAEKEFDLKRRQAYQYISVYEKLGKEFVQSNAQLGITKLALLATANPEDRTEIMETEDIAKITTRELEELLDKCKNQGEQLSLLQEENGKLEARLEEIENIETRLQNARAAAEQAKENAEKEKAEFLKQIEELKQAAQKPPESADKSNFKVLLSTVYRDMLGLVEYINDTENIEDRKQYFKKALEILHVCEDSIKERVEIPPEIPKEPLTSHGVVDIGSIPPISEKEDDDE